MKFHSGQGGFFAALALTALAAATANAQENLKVFLGDAEESGITAVPWGSGMVTTDPQAHQEGKASFKIVTHGLYQGADLTFAKPFDLGPFVANKTSFLQFNVYLPELFANPNNGGGAPGNGFPGGGRPGGGRPGGGPPAGLGGAGGGRGRRDRGGQGAGEYTPPTSSSSGLPDHGPSPGFFQPPPPPPGGGFGGGPGGAGRPGLGGGPPPGNIPGANGRNGNGPRTRPLENIREGSL